MATTQYIGARYVPLFAEPIEWDKTKQYEPLTIVTHEGNSYTSRQFVPTGIEITNETFWALTGNFNAQVEQYRKEVTEYDGRITTAQDTADSAKSAADAATAAVTAEQSRAEAKEAEIQSLAETNETKVAHLDAQMAATTGSELLTRISDEVTSRSAADTALDASIKKEVSARENADTHLEESLTALVNGKFPVQTSEIADGSVTAPKIADSAVNAILQGLTIRAFNASDNSADNDGLLCPSGCKLAGFYISELQILVVTSYAISNTRVDKDSHNMRLPNYVQRPSAIYQLSDVGVIVWNSSSNFKTWAGIRIDPDGYIYTNSTIQTPDLANQAATAIAYLRPYASGASVTSSNAYDAFKSQSGVI